MKKAICLVLIMLLVTSLAACGNNHSTAASQPYNVAFVVGIANNNPLVDPSVITELSELPSHPNTSYTVINAESDPQVICSGTIPDFSDEGYTSVMMTRLENSIRADIFNQITEAQPRSPEIDIAAATTQAVRALRANQVPGRRNLLVYHLSGISSAGLINMITVPVCELDVEASVSTLAESMAVDMSAIDVIMYCCGDVSGEDQGSLSLNEQKTLRDFYEKLFLTLGANTVTFRDDIPAEGSYTFDQKVSVMRTNSVGNGLSAQVIPSGDVTQESDIEDAFAEGNIISFDETTIGFDPGSTEVADPAAATEALSYVIDYMLAHPDFELLICGTSTSAGTEASCKVFSEKRASVVRNLLINAGIDKSKIHILGCGYSSNLYIPDRTGSGDLDETIAPKNRSVKMVSYTSDTAQQILDSLNPS